MSPSPVSSLFVMHFGSNTGYALAPLESLFFDSGLELAAGRAELVHFAYPDFEQGPPKTLPPDFRNLLTFDFQDESKENIRRIAEYVKQHGIRLVVIFDIQPAGPLFRPLREAGAGAIVAYWGAPISGRMPWWKLLAKRIGFAASRSRVDGLIFETHAMADLAIHGRGVPESMIDIVPLGVDTGRFRPAASDYVRQQFGFPAGKKIVVYAGHMEPRKGVAVLVEAAIELLCRRKRSDVCFLICGNKGDESRPYERMYAGMGIDALLCFGGYRRDMPEIYPGCYCGVLPSTGWDSFTTTSLEMAASGLPVLASDLQGLAEAIQDKKTGLLFEPGNVRQLADSIEKLLNDPELATRYGQQGRLRCETDLSKEMQRLRLTEALKKRLG